MKEGALFLRSNILFVANVFGNKVFWGESVFVFKCISFLIYLFRPKSKCELIFRLGKKKKKLKANAEYL